MKLIYHCWWNIIMINYSKVFNINISWVRKAYCSYATFGMIWWGNHCSVNNNNRISISNLMATKIYNLHFLIRRYSFINIQPKIYIRYSPKYIWNMISWTFHSEYVSFVLWCSQAQIYLFWCVLNYTLPKIISVWLLTLKNPTI